MNKQNGKQGCAGERVVYFLDPFGSAHTAHIWLHRTAAAYHQSTGFRPNRRREQSILQVKLVRWQLGVQKLDWFANFYDQANAFASTSYERSMRPYGKPFRQKMQDYWEAAIASA